MRWDCNKRRFEEAARQPRVSRRSRQLHENVTTDCSSGELDASVARVRSIVRSAAAASVARSFRLAQNAAVRNVY